MDLGVEEIPHYRLQVWGRAACGVWDDHHWIQFHAAIDFVILVLCEHCGRTPLEALAALPFKVPPG